MDLFLIERFSYIVCLYYIYQCKSPGNGDICGIDGTETTAAVSGLLVALRGLLEVTRGLVPDEVSWTAAVLLFMHFSM